LLFTLRIGKADLFGVNPGFDLAVLAVFLVARRVQNELLEFLVRTADRLAVDIAITLCQLTGDIVTAIEPFIRHHHQPA